MRTPVFYALGLDTLEPMPSPEDDEEIVSSKESREDVTCSLDIPVCRKNNEKITCSSLFSRHDRRYNEVPHSPANHSSHRVPVAAGQVEPIAGSAHRHERHLLAFGRIHHPDGHHLRGRRLVQGLESHITGGYGLKSEPTRIGARREKHSYKSGSAPGFECLNSSTFPTSGRNALL